MQTRGPEGARAIPCEAHDDGEADGQGHDGVRQHRVGPVEAVHDRFDDLQHGESDNAVPDKRSEDAPPFQLREQRHGVHDAHPGFEPSTSANDGAGHHGVSQAEAETHSACPKGNGRPVAQIKGRFMLASGATLSTALPPATRHASAGTTRQPEDDSRFLRMSQQMLDAAYTGLWSCCDRSPRRSAVLGSAG